MDDMETELPQLWPPELQLAEALVGTVNANVVCGKAPGTVLIDEVRWGSCKVGGEFVTRERDVPLLQKTFSTVMGESDGKLHAFGVYNPNGWNRIWDLSMNTFRPVVDRLGKPLYESAEFPDTLDIVIREMS